MSKILKLWSAWKQSHHIETSQLICNTNQSNGFYMICVFTERYFQTDHSDVYEKFCNQFWNFISFHLKITYNFSRILKNQLWMNSFQVKLQACSCKFTKTWTSSQVFCLTFRKTYFKKHLLMAAFVVSYKTIFGNKKGRSELLFIPKFSSYIVPWSATFLLNVVD